MKICAASVLFAALVSVGCVPVVFVPNPDASDLGGQGGAGGSDGIGGAGGNMGVGGDVIAEDAGVDVGAADATDSQQEIDAGTDVGQDAAPGVPQPSVSGQLVITEIMYDSRSATPPAGGTADDAGEWVELYNATATALDIFGCVLADTSHQDVIGRHVVVEPGASITLSRSNPGFTADYVYSLTKFSDAGDQAKITCGTTLIDAVVFTPVNGFTLSQGYSLSLDPSHYNAIDNDVAANWCLAKAAYHLNDFGTPGAMNPSCL